MISHISDFSEPDYHSPSDKVPSLPSREYTFDLDGDARYLDSDNESNVSGYSVDCSNMGK